MTEMEIKSLIRHDRWVTVQPTRAGVWKAYIYKKIVSGWKVEYSTKAKTPKDAYEWIEEILENIKL
tara:strand:+ start:502 stop:699 length:198 start_codon:yes stop_codon:yes gene_type:complete